MEEFDTIRTAFWDAVSNKNKIKALQLLEELKRLARYLGTADARIDVQTAKSAIDNWK